MLKGMPLLQNLMQKEVFFRPKIIRASLLFLCIICFSSTLCAQSITIAYRWSNKSQESTLPKYFQQTHTLDNATLIDQEIENAKIKLASVGYFAATIRDSLIQDKHFLWITFGKKYAGIKVLGDAEWLAWLPKGKKSDFLSLEEYSSFLTKTLAEFHANGYPFASFHYSNFLEQDQVLTVSVSIDKGRKMIWKELRIKGDSSLSVQAMEAELKFKSGDNFTVEKQGEIYTRLKQLNYLQIIKQPEYQFSVDGVTVYLYVKGTKISSFNGAIGLQPNPISQKMGLTGDVQLKLVNTLKRAEQLDFVWRSVKPATQLMNLRFAYPFLFHSSFGTELKFQLYKRDSTFLELKSGLAIQYALSNKLLVKGLYSFTSNNRLYASNSNLDFPNTTSFRNTMFGLGITFRTLDYLPNPTKGIQCVSEAYVGQRKNQPDSTAPTPTNRLSLSWEQYVALSKRIVLRYFVSLDSYNASTIYSNECYRFGGLSNQRGFNEENFLATTKSVNQMELRYLLDRNSAVFLFFDQCLYENRSNGNYNRDNPYGFGFGTNLGSKAGIFSLVYGLGIEKNNPIDLRSGKIHFGYIAYF